ncbi:MAG: chromosome segregation protein SMC [Acidobacteria bacterium]|nr:chromosome segregation protein SMC [Acidobacteriota bacterium]
MFLKSLTLKGFKSFADTTVMELEPGVTVVVGPNGSGKSNVVDAIAWVLGAQAPSAVRSQKMDDVIFAGTEKRPALGRAEVVLTLDNSAGLLPIEFTEVTVGRTLFRSGESEYSINGVECRLLDVQELLSDAGVGRQQHVIISQGQIDAVLNARPEDRRAIIEEAAGVLKYRKRKEKAERRLDSTEANLLRVQDLIREVRRQLRPLERQAEAARRHGELVAELKTLQIFVAGREIASTRARLVALAGDKANGARSEQELRSRLAELDTLVLSSEAELTALGDTGVSDQLVRVEQLRERARGLAALLAERRRSMERDRSQFMDADVMASLEGDAAALRAELDSINAELAVVDPEREALESDEAEFAARREAAGDEEVPEMPTPVAASAAAEVRGELRTLRAADERDRAELQRVATRIAQLDDRALRLAADVERLGNEYESAEGAAARIEGDVRGQSERRTAAESSLDAATQASAGAAASLAHWNARVEVLREALETARSRAGLQHLADVDGVVGALVDLIRIEDGWEAAVHAALGDAVAGIVMRDAAAARTALSSLDAMNVNGAVLALGGARETPAQVPMGARPVRGLVRAAGAEAVTIDALLDSLLARAFVADSWATAVDIALSNPSFHVVTRRGDRFAPSGWRIGAQADAVTAAALEDAVQRQAAANTESERRASELSRARAEVQSARDALADLERRHEQLTKARHTAADSLQRVTGERREVIAELDAVRSQRDDVAGRLERASSRIAELEAVLPRLEADEAVEAETMRAIGVARAGLDAEASRLALRRKDLEVKSVGLVERQQFVQRRLDETEARLAADTEARAQAAEQRIRLQRSFDAIVRLSDLVDRHRITTEALLVELHEARRRQSDEVREVAARLDSARRERQATERELDEQRERGRRIEIEEAEVRMRLEAAVEALRRDLEIEPEVAEAAEMPVVPEGATPIARVRELERELRLMGPINPLALQEFTELQKRHEFLEAQLEDVRNTRRDLLRVIKAVDEEIQSVFGGAFNDVARNFQDLFGLLFPGGTGRLTLTLPEDLLNTGIEVEAKPGGKNVKKLSLLSGGERSLTALAFLFAVFRSRPSPFYVMDEVEAALDDVNLSRFLGLLAEFRRDAQLLVVSHQKRTMEAADCLLGVTMQPGGSSKVIVEHASSAT